jgi:hypothetical protein
MTAVAGLALPVAAMWAALLASGVRSTSQSRLMTAVLAFGTGVGLSSMIAVLSVTSGIGLDRRFVAFDAALWITLAVVSLWRVRRDVREPSMVSGRDRHATALDWAARAGFAAVALMVVGAEVVEFLRSPHGQWDAWAIWNQKARFLVRGGTDDWHAMLAISWANPGHPMLVSASVARLWAYAGSELTLIPAAIAVLFGAAIAAAVIAALDATRPRAWIAGAFVIAPTTFVHQVAAQTADLPLAFFMAIALIMLRDYFTADNAATRRKALILAGMFVALAAWTKNEGVMLFAATSLVVGWCLLRRRQLADTMWWIGGAAPIAIVAWYKLVVAPVAPEYMPATETVASTAARFFDPERWLLTASLVARYMVRWGGALATGVLPITIAAAVAAALPSTGRSFRYLLATLVMMTAGYAALWLSAPFDAEWIVTTTFDRLMIQLWPSLVVIAFSIGLTGPAAD